ncbi:hypothetical protein WMY93_032802 [Mugilogobius chulae]|uniref:Uncharacterized protein n=1 Tax=Mugilogobius chulae TaxID=88201 RepID=A0AAW0MIR6_9GOBI
MGLDNRESERAQSFAALSNCILSGPGGEVRLLFQDALEVQHCPTQASKASAGPRGYCVTERHGTMTRLLERGHIPLTASRTLDGTSSDLRRLVTPELSGMPPRDLLSMSVAYICGDERCVISQRLGSKRHHFLLHLLGVI